MNFLIAVLVARCKDATIVNFLRAVLVARCKDATTVNFLRAVLVARCRDATIVNFLKAVLLARCKDATIVNFLMAVTLANIDTNPLKSELRAPRWVPKEQQIRKNSVHNFERFPLSRFFTFLVDFGSLLGSPLGSLGGPWAAKEHQGRPQKQKMFEKERSKNGS